jgi:hypothetical protein
MRDGFGTALAAACGPAVASAEPPSHALGVCIGHILIQMRPRKAGLRPAGKISSQT